MAETPEERNQRRFNEMADSIAVVQELAHQASMDAVGWKVKDGVGEMKNLFDLVRSGGGLYREVPWYGFDGKRPATGRRTTTLATDIGYNDARWAGNRAAHRQQAAAIATLSKQVADLTALVQKLVK